MNSGFTLSLRMAQTLDPDSMFIFTIDSLIFLSSPF